MGLPDNNGDGNAREREERIPSRACPRSAASELRVRAGGIGGVATKTEKGMSRGASTRDS